MNEVGRVHFQKIGKEIITSFSFSKVFASKPSNPHFRRDIEKYMMFDRTYVLESILNLMSATPNYEFVKVIAHFDNGYFEIVS